ncbi:MAG: efflux RND transporter periplasmic adaptor subunit, partial [Victivallaceae bacterium]|nr:efflux RND transporter periplasmic adaptor subunit [Victivallaceae bacterium]
VIVLAVGGWAVSRIMSRRAAEREAALAKRNTETSDVDRTFKVRRDNLVIGLLQGGSVNASQKHKLSLQANYKTKLLWVIDENSKVKAGDSLAKFETDGLVEQIENQEIELDNLNKELALALESERILASTNLADLQSAQENLLQTEDALRKYRRFERVSKRDSLELAINSAEDTLTSARKSYKDIRDSEVSSKSEDAEAQKREKLKTAQAKIDTAENALGTAEDNRKVFRRYDHPSKITRLLNAYEQAKLNQRKVKISTSSKEIQQKKSIENLRMRTKRASEQLERYRSYLPMMELTAPVDGVVIYGDPDRRWGNVDVKPGIDVGKGQVLITIPEMSNLVVDFDLPEQYRSKISIGDRAVICPDSLPGEKFEGEVMHIDTLPVNLVMWDSSSPKIYKSKIKLDAQSAKLVSGMSVRINIVTKILPDVLFVPVEAIFENEDRFFVYRSTLAGPKETPVVIGESNDSFVEIKSGLQGDEVVCLYRPYQKKGE